MSDFDFRRNIRLLYLHTVCLNAVFVLPVLLAFYRDEIGLGFHDLLIGESVFAASLILFDVPCGYVADRFGRKISLILGAFFYGLGLFCMLLADNLFLAATAQGVIGIGVSFSSGANSAFLYDTLLSAGRAHEFRRREGFRFALGLYSCAGACILGGVLYTVDHALPVLVEISLCIVGFIGNFFLTEPPRHRAVVHHNPFKDIAATVIYALRGHKDIGFVVLAMVFVFSATKICMWSIQPYAATLGWSGTVTGFFLSGVMLSGALSGHLGHRFLPRLEGLPLLLILLGILSILLLGAGLSVAWFGILFLGLQSIVFGFGMPRAQEFLNNHVDSARRATVLSTANFATSIGFIPMSQLVGFFTDTHGISYALLVYSGVLACILVMLRMLSNRSTFLQKKEILEEDALTKES